MRLKICMLLALAASAFAQSAQQPLMVTRIYNITSTWVGECGAGTVDNRSAVSRQNNYHAFAATGAGTWSVTIQYSDTSCSGPWTSFGAQAVVTQASNPNIGFGNGYHLFISFAISGANASTAQVAYAASRDYYLSTSVGAISFPCTIAQGCTGQTSAPAALQALLAGSSQGTVTNKVQMAGTNNGVAGSALCDDASGSTTTSGCATALPSGSQTQVLRIQPNTGNNSTYQFATLPVFRPPDYAYTAIQPGGSLTGGGGAQAITVPVCPLGIYSSAQGWAPIYVSGGSGTSEAITPTGGTCSAATLGVGGGTIIVSPANSHSGAWTLQSTGGGLPEAINAVCSAGGGTVQMAAGNVPIYGTINIGNGTAGGQSTCNNVAIVGAGAGTAGAIAGLKFGATVLQWYGPNGGNMVSVNGPIIGVRIGDLTFDAAPSGTIATTALYSMHSYIFRYQNLFASGVSGFAYDLEAYENPVGFLAGSGDGIVDGLFTSNLQTTGSGLNAGGTSFTTSPHLDVARVAYRNLSLLVGSSGTGLRLQFTDSSMFDQVFTLGGAYGLMVVNPSGLPNNFPGGITIHNAYFGGTTPLSTPVGWHPTQASDLYGGLLFMPWGKESGNPPGVDGVYGFTDSNEYFGFKLYPQPMTLVNGANNDLDIGVAGFVRITGPSAAYSITGFKHGRDGRVLELVGNTGGPLTISNQNSGSPAGDRIAVPGSADITLSNGTHAASFVYSGPDSCWFFVSGK